MYLSARTSTSSNCGLVLELGVGRVGGQLAEPEVADPALAGDLERRLDPVGLVVLVARQGRSQHVAVVAAGQPPVAGQDQQTATS